MSGQLRPKKKLRVERDAAPEGVHDDGHSWAVSYADFLMVLLSFFIIFFSVDEKKKDTIIERIAKATGEKVAGEGSAKIDANVVNQEPQPHLPKGIKEVAESVGGVFVDGTAKGNKLYIYLDDNSYQPGQVELPSEKLAKLTEVLEKLRPFMPDINLTFEGHTDDKVFRKAKSKYLADNFDLSSLRATKAIQHAVRLGYDPMQLWARGVAEYQRGSRTLSVVVAAKEVSE